MSDLIDIEIENIKLQVSTDQDANENLFADDIFLNGNDITEWFTDGEATLSRYSFPVSSSCGVLISIIAVLLVIEFLAKKSVILSPEPEIFRPPT